MTDVELRTEADGTPGLRIRAATYEEDYAVRDFTETIKRGAFRSSLSRSDLDVVLRVEHDSRDVLARTPRTLRLEEDREGLVGYATLDPQDPLTQQTVRRVERGVLKEASFAFKIERGGDSWNADSTRREIRAVNLHRGDISLVVYGANRNTGAVILRSAQERRFMANVVTSTGWFGPALARQMMPDNPGKGYDAPDSDTDEVVCIHCAGRGQMMDGSVCPKCDGTGMVDAEPDNDGDEPRREFSAAERQRLAREGKALSDGSFPIVTRGDLENAVIAWGRAKDKAAAKAHIVKRARALGATSMLPTGWGSQRSAVLAPNDSGELFRELRLANMSLTEEESKFRSEMRAKQERVWDSTPEAVAARERFEAYARSVR
jgi:HK97 family phage prohead protease